jgi:hypothetical protein
MKYIQVFCAVNRDEFVSDKTSYIILRGRWCHIIVLKVHAPAEDKTDDVEDSLPEELERAFNKFSKFYIKIMLGEFSAKSGKEDIFKPTVENESLHEISNDNRARVVNFAPSKNLSMFPHRNIHKYTLTSPAGETHNQIDHILKDRRKAFENT